MVNIYRYFLSALCCIALIGAFVSAFPLKLSAQMMPSMTQGTSLQLLQPNGAERMLVGSEYRIRWQGIDSTRLVSLQYSTDNGRTWKRIADSVRGTEYLWKPIPNEPSDSCLVKVTGMAGDSTVPVGMRLTQFQVPPSPTTTSFQMSYWGASAVQFSPDGTKILEITYSRPLGTTNAFLGWAQTNYTVRDGRTGAVLYTLPSVGFDSISFVRNYNWGWWGNGSFGYGRSSHGWSPDGRSILSQLSDTTFGIFDAQNGALIRTILVPRRGNFTRCMAMQWTAQGQEILATVYHRFINPLSTIGQGDTLRTVMMRFNASSGMLTNTPFQVGFSVFSGFGCNYFGVWGGSNVSNDGERRLAFAMGDTSLCWGTGSLVIRSTKDNALLTTIPISNMPFYSYWGWGGGSNGSQWSPNDSLISIPTSSPSPNSQFAVLVFNTHTGAPVQRFNTTQLNATSFGQWSPDSKKLMFTRNYSPTGNWTNRVIGDIATGVISPQIEPIHSSWWWGGWGWGWGGNSWGQSGGTDKSSYSWSPDGRFVAGFLYEENRSKNGEDNALNTVGIWDARTGCLTQTFRLPFPDGITDNKRTFAYNTPQWSADGKRLLLYSPFIHSGRNPVRGIQNGRIVDYEIFTMRDFDGTAIIAPVNVGTIPCQEDQSDSVFSILPRGQVRTADVNFPTLLCEQTVVTQSTVIANTGLKDLFVQVPTVSGEHAADFRIVSLNGQPVPTTQAIITLPKQWGTLTLGVEFMPRALGFRFGQISLNDSSGAELATIALAGQKDTLAIAPIPSSTSSTFSLDFGRLRQFQITSGSVSIRNTGTVPLSLGVGGLVQAQQIPRQGAFVSTGQAQTRIQSNSGAFVIDSLSPSVLQPDAVGSIHLTFLKNDVEGVARDTALLLRCGQGEYSLTASATVVPNAPRLEVDSVLSFGTLVCEASSEATLQVRNVGGVRLRLISAPITNPDFSHLQTVREIDIEPFTSYAIPIRFTPSAGGTATAGIILNTNDSRQFRVTVRLQGQKTLLQYAWQPQTVDFGNVGFGITKTQTVTLENQGTAPLTWGLLPQRLTDDFVIERVQPNPVPAGASAQVTVRFLGSRKAMPITAQLNLTMNDACRTQSRLNLAARVLDPQPRIVIADTVRFGRLLCETESRATITVRNEGDADLLINSVAVENIPASSAPNLDFPKDSAILSATTIRPNESATMRLYFRPSRISTHAARILLKTNDTATAPMGEIRVYLAGIKDSVSFSASKTSVNLSTVAENTPLFDTITVRNTGTTPLRWEGALPQGTSPQGTFPRMIDTTFVLERIEPAVTESGASSQVIVRFVGGMAGLRAERTITLQAASSLNPSCVRSFAVNLRGEVLREPRLAAPQGASARILCENSTTFTIRLANVGTDDLLLQTTELTQNPNNIFRIVSAPSRIAPRTGRDSVRITAQTAQTGVFTAQVRIRSNAANLPDTTLTLTLRKDSSGLQVGSSMLNPVALDFGAFAANTPASRTVTLLNTGTIPQGFMLPQRAGASRQSAFTLESLEQNPIAPSSQTQARVGFSGGSGGVVRDTLRLADSCGRITLLPLQARVVEGFATLPDTIALQVGDIAEVPVMLRNRNGVERGMEAVFRLSIENISLVDILSPMPQTSVMTRQTRTMGQTLTFRSMIASEAEIEPLVRLRVRGLLGNATTTTIVLDSLQISGVQQSSRDTAYFRTKGINYAGGAPRLISSPNLTALTIAPNPANDRITLTVSVLQAAPMLVELTDIIGQKRVLFDGSVESGSQTLTLSASQFASGAYLLTVRLGAEFRSQMMTIVR
ncbi:MAG: choice-of-anchor D domain-containing protein [Candidatus Kapabacteria bacterium]|jgi:hypothetical protein|nr:choice-of-anchor D domain-containing protein [Candidatus Kapabacteria bacterium]